MDRRAKILTEPHCLVNVPQYRQPYFDNDTMEEMALEWEKVGFVRKSTSSWNSPVLLVKKANGKPRFCVDYRRLNLATSNDAYPLPRIDDILDSLGDITRSCMFRRSNP